MANDTTESDPRMTDTNARDKITIDTTEIDMIIADLIGIDTIDGALKAIRGGTIEMNRIITSPETATKKASHRADSAIQRILQATSKDLSSRMRLIIERYPTSSQTNSTV